MDRRHSRLPLLICLLGAVTTAAAPVGSSEAVNTTVITLDQAPQAYADFDKGAARKFVIDPHGSLKKKA